MPGPATPSNTNRSDLTGLLLGAGASYDLGMPLVWELTDELKSWLTPDKLHSLNQRWRNAGVEFGYPDTSIGNLASVLEREDMHYESLLGHLQVQSRRSPDDAQAYCGLYMFLAELIYALLQERHLLNVAYIERNIRYLDGIEAFARQNAPLWIFSLNHDLIIECFAADVGIPLKSGFTEHTIRLPRRDQHGKLVGELKAEVLPEDVLKRRGLPFFNLGQTGINLLKIHGSLDIFAFQDGHHLLKLLSSGQGIQGVLSALRSANRELKYVEPRWPGGALTAPSEIVYEDEFGEMQFLRRSLVAGAYKFDPRHSQVMPNDWLNHFQTHLKYLTTLVCIGYGFRDQHITEVIRDWLESSSKRRLTIVDPRASRIPSEFLHLALQVEIVASDCTDYLDSVGGISRSRPEQARRQFGNWKRVKGSEADTIFSDFRQEEINHCIERLSEWAKTLPVQDGDLDVAKLGMNLEELVRAGIAEAAIPTPTEVLERFRRRELD